MISSSIALHSALSLAMLEFNRPVWWLVMIPLGVAIIWIGRKSLSGLSSRTRKFALVARLIVAALLIGALAEPQWRRQSKDVAVTLLVDASRSAPDDLLKQTRTFLVEAAKGAKPDDMIGFVTVARNAGIQAIPRKIVETSAELDAKNAVNPDATDLAAGVRAAMSIMPPNAANRLLLISDGNETMGDLMDAARAAEAAKVPIDVVPVRYAIEREVIVDRLLSPATARPGEIANLRVVLTATRPTDGQLTVLINDQPVDLDPQGPGFSSPVTLVAGTNVQTVPVRLPDRGPVKFSAVFEPTRAGAGGGDTLTENNRADSVTFISGGARVLVIRNSQETAEAQAGPLIRAINASVGSGGRTVDVRTARDAWASVAELASYDCVVLVNAAAFEFTEAQQQELRSYIHDLGGGLVMTGGDQAFGAGGWIGSTLADALPIKLDPPQKRQMPRGALGLIMHSCEMPEGNFWGRRTAEAAINSLQAQDYAGVIEYNWQGRDPWVFPMAIVGDKSAALRSLGGLTFGDAPEFESLMSATITALEGVQAGQKHAIIISDGDPTPPTDRTLQRFVNAKVSVSTVLVFPHNAFANSTESRTMQRVARATGGNYYEITNNTGNLNSLPEIFIKEAQTVKRSLIWEGDPTRPQIVTMTEGLRGISQVPSVTGYVVAADREGLSQIVLRGPENDPILAQWQHGLGRVVTFTSDAAPKWGTAWLNWDQFRQFWDQHLKWAMRPATNPNIRVVTVDQGDRTQVIVEAVDNDGARLNFLRWTNRVVTPGNEARAFDLVQTGPGRYEATIDSASSGVYTLNMSWQDPASGASGGASGTAGGSGAPANRGSVQAAVTRPFADEFRALRDNAALLEQVAQRTGGRVLDFTSTDPSRGPAAMWSREGLTIPVSLRPIWLAAALIGLGLFLADVALRRVRIDPRAIGRKIGALFGASKSAATTQMESLAQAREKARQRLAERRAAIPGAPGGGAGSGNGIERTALAPPGLDPATAASMASRKFVASAAELAEGAKAVEAATRGGATGSGAAPVVTRSQGTKDGGGEGESGMSRLMKAKKRAQDELKE
ncbi:MAG: glutamine amidotransferase [Phycisphaerales bacterium]|jgi:uncharacterized membrane protein|nr:glutamine amidotransferase [Phycisphaerales bacterium]